MQLLLLVLKQSSLLLDAVSIKHAAKKTYPKSLLSPIPSMQQRRYLIINPIHIRSIQQPFFVNYVDSSLQTKKIPLSSGNVPAISIGDFTRPLTKIQSHLIHSSYSQVNRDYCKKINSDNIISLWKMIFQASDGKERQFLDLVDNNCKDIELSYIKGGPWLQLFCQVYTQWT